jgi:hypothetical protein
LILEVSPAKDAFPFQRFVSISNIQQMDSARSNDRMNDAALIHGVQRERETQPTDSPVSSITLDSDHSVQGAEIGVELPENQPIHFAATPVTTTQHLPHNRNRPEKDISYSSAAQGHQESKSTLPEQDTISTPNHIVLDDSKPVTPVLKSQRRCFIIEWRWELFTWLVGTTAVWVMLALLVTFNGKPLRVWKSQIQITAIVSVLSQLAQSALTVSVVASIGQLRWLWLRDRQRTIIIERLDEATRGPEGSLRLLLEMFRQPWHFQQ